MLTKNSHMSYSDRQIIETGIENGSTKQAIATTVMTNIDTLPSMHSTTTRGHLHLHDKVSMRQ